MSAQYRLHVLTAAGALKHVLAQNPGGDDPTRGGFLELAYVNVVNGYGTCAFTLDGGHAALVDLVNRCQVEVWRADAEAGIAWYRDWSGFFVDEKYFLKDGRFLMFTGTCVGDAFLLQDREVLWYAGAADRSEFVAEKSETIMKTLVTYNCTADASVANGRVRSGVISGVSVETDGANGTTQDWRCAWDNLLKTLQNLAGIAGGDFDVIKTGAAAWEFRWYTDRRGTDRSATVVFSLEHGNMAEPVYSITRSGRKTAVAVGGNGEETAREVVVRTASGYSAANNIEKFYNGAGQNPTTAMLNALGDQELYKFRDQEKIDIKPIQTQSSQYGRDYFLGDKVTVRFFNVTATPKIVSAATTVSHQAPFGAVEIGLSYD